MKVPISWLREYVDAPAAPAELARLLVGAGVGVEAIEGEILDLEITANRADLLSMLGVAREVGALQGKPLCVPQVSFAEEGDDVARAFKVEVESPEACPRYTARLVRGVRMGPSPAWMAGRLEAAGIRAINVIVDVTNYVLLECGQPLHAFDARKLRGGKIVVRRGRSGEKMTAIDGTELSLTEGTLVIADGERPVAIAGVMGGKDTEISDGTVDVLIESAQFDPVLVRRTSRRLGLASESSYRFERGVDYDTVDLASRRAVQLIVQLAGGKVAKSAVDIAVPASKRPVTQVRPERVCRVLGMTVSRDRIREILAGLGCGVKESGQSFEVTPPPGRRDLKVEVDYVEEVARVEGYDKVPCDTGLSLRVALERPEDRVRHEVRATLSSMGCYEALTMSFVEAGTPGGESFWTKDAPLPLKDPAGNVDRALRTALAPGLLKVLQTNESYKEDLRAVFEIGKVYRRQENVPGDLEVLGIAAPGDPLGIKGLLETLFGRLGVDVRFDPKGELKLGGKAIGYLAEGPADLRSAVSVAEVDFGELAKSARLVRPYAEFNRQPPVARDLSVVLADAVSWRDVESVVRAAAPATLESVRFMSEYRGKPIAAGEKGWAFSMVFRAADRTLVSAEADEAVQGILRALESKLGARLR